MDSRARTLHFYLLHTQPACGPWWNCDVQATFGPGSEAGWQNVTVYAEEDLRDTVLDCLHCHEPGGHDWIRGVGTQRVLLMQERGAPWC